MTGHRLERAFTAIPWAATVVSAGFVAFATSRDEPERAVVVAACAFVLLSAARAVGNLLYDSTTKRASGRTGGRFGLLLPVDRWSPAGLHPDNPADAPLMTSERRIVAALAVAVAVVVACGAIMAARFGWPTLADRDVLRPGH